MLHTLPTYHHYVNSYKEVNVLKYRILGGIIESITQRFFIDYRAFQRCLRASLEGFVVFVTAP